MNRRPMGNSLRPVSSPLPHQRQHPILQISDINPFADHAGLDPGYG